MNRGRRHEDIFHDVSDYLLFLEVLRDTVKMWNLRVSAYCLMPNHYHILVQTPDGNLSRCMRHLNGVYTQRFNCKNKLDGQLFRGRYKSVLVEEDNHLLELLRYIHRNPLKAGMVTDLNAYSWSSHRGYLANEQGWSWLYRDTLLNMFSTTRNKAFSDYLEFVTQHNTDEIEYFFARKNLPLNLWLHWLYRQNQKPLRFFTTGTRIFWCRNFISQYQRCYYCSLRCL